MDEHRFTHERLEAGVRLKSRASHKLSIQAEGAVILFGRGDTLGDFGLFAEQLKHDLRRKYGNHVEAVSCQRKSKFWEELQRQRPFKIKELHIFSHSIGAGLFLAYHDPAIQSERRAVFARLTRDGHSITYDDVLKIEVGMLLTDDILSAKFDVKNRCRAALAVGATGKIWGCNSCRSGFEFGVEDTDDARYWRLLNERNFPKPSIAGSLAAFLGIPIKGASSGAHVEVFDPTSDAWVTTTDYRKKHGTVPSGTLKHRLHPDHGEYSVCAP